jgi:hypothetical protein
MKRKGQGRKEYIVVRQADPDSEIVESLPMTIKQACHGVLFFEKLKYFKVDIVHVKTIEAKP